MFGCVENRSSLNPPSGKLAGRPLPVGLDGICGEPLQQRLRFFLPPARVERQRTVEEDPRALLQRTCMIEQIERCPGLSAG